MVRTISSIFSCTFSSKRQPEKQIYSQLMANGLAGLSVTEGTRLRLNDKEPEEENTVAGLRVAGKPVTNAEDVCEPSKKGQQGHSLQRGS